MAKKKNTNWLTEKILKNSDNVFAAALNESKFFKNDEEFVDVGIPLLNLALSSDINKGLVGGITTIAGESKRFKTLFGLYMVQAYQKKYPESSVIFYDTEFGTPRDYLEQFDLDWSRVVHVPINDVEELRHELSSTLNMLKEDYKNNKNIKLMVFIDSIGNLASRKETVDAIDGKNKADMTRAKALKSFFRITTSTLKMLRIPLIAINHTYKDQSGPNPMYAATIVSGGQGITLASDNIWIITRRNSKNSTGLLGYDFIINIDKSRFVKEKSQFPITVHFDKGLFKYSGLADIATKLNIIKKEKSGKQTYFCYKDLKCLGKNIDSNDEFWKNVFENNENVEKINGAFALKNKTSFTIENNKQSNE